MDNTLRNDMASFRLPDDLAGQLRDSTIIVTGATGLIGRSFVRCVDALQIGVKWILPVRDTEKARLMLTDSDADLTDGHITIVGTDLKDFFELTALKADYIIHCASPTNGRYMTEHPAETFLFAVDATRAALEYSRRCGVRGMVYVSSIEYYGQRSDDALVGEESEGRIDHQSPRSSYPLGKQAAEYLCFSYASEYGVPCRTARLTQTFGAGISPSDNRVFAQFARSVLAGTDIVLHTEGRSAKPYCYTTDCVSALIYVLLKGAPGQAYNVATPGTYVSIRQLAELFRDTFNPSIAVITQCADCGYAPETRINLDSSRLLGLGWKPTCNLYEMLRRLVASLRDAEFGDKS